MDDVDNNDDIRVTDSGVDSEQTSTSNNSVFEDIRRDEAISVLAEESSDDISSVCSTENIEKEIVGKMKSMFEQQINETQERQSTFLNWKKSNLVLKGTEISPNLTEVNNKNHLLFSHDSNKSTRSSDSESSNNTVEILRTSSEIPRELEHELMLTKEDECKNNDNMSDSESEKEIIRNIGNESVNRLKGVYENLANTLNESNDKDINKKMYLKTTSHVNFRTEAPSMFRGTSNSENEHLNSKERTVISENDDTDDNSGDDVSGETMNMNSGENIRKESVNKLKHIFESQFNKTMKQEPQSSMTEAHIPKTSSMINLRRENFVKGSFIENELQNDNSSSADQQESDDLNSIFKERHGEKDKVTKLKRMFEDITIVSSNVQFPKCSIRKAKDENVLQVRYDSRGEFIR